MKVEQIDMSPEAVTNRLKTMEQLWELSVNLMKAEEISEKSSEKGWKNRREDKMHEHLETIPTVG